MPVVVHMIEINPAAWVEHVSYGVLLVVQTVEGYDNISTMVLDWGGYSGVYCSTMPTPTPSPPPLVFY